MTTTLTAREATPEPFICYIHNTNHGTDNQGIAIFCPELDRLVAAYEAEPRPCTCGWCVDCGAWG